MGLLLKTSKEVLFGGNEVSFIISPGKLNLIMGATGIGKTSLVELLALRSRSLILKGTINRNGLNHPTYYAFLPQILWDIDDITIKELIILANKSVAVMETKHRAYLEARAKRDLSSLSGGELRFCLFLLVSCQHQQVHIYDEPFLNLDPEKASEVKKVLFKLVARGIIVIIVAHKNDYISLEDPSVNIIQLPRTC
jgi:ABC-type multidrug transport system ATPase subunit